MRRKQSDACDSLSIKQTSSEDQSLLIIGNFAAPHVTSKLGNGKMMVR